MWGTNRYEALSSRAQTGRREPSHGHVAEEYQHPSEVRRISTLRLLSGHWSVSVQIRDQVAEVKT